MAGVQIPEPVFALSLYPAESGTDMSKPSTNLILQIHCTSLTFYDTF